MKILIKRLVLLLLSFVATSYVHAADFSVVMSSKGNPMAVRISGKIEKGDYHKLAKFIAPLKNDDISDAFLNMVFLNSPGGDVAEAMKIANLLNMSLGSTMVAKDDICFSACVILWAGGVTRSLDNSAKLGVHRLSLTRNEISVKKTEKAVMPASQSVESFLVRVGIPHKIIDKMNETSPTDLFIIDNKWLTQEDLFNAVSEQPSYIDVVEKVCGQSPWVSAMKNAKPVDKDAGLQWGLCADNVRVKNQKLEMKQIINVLIAAIGDRELRQMIRANQDGNGGAGQ